MRSRRTWCAVLCVMFVLAIMPVARAAVTVGPGDTGENVKKIQRRLIQYDYMDGTADGVYGEKTRQAVIKFQKKYGLTADGVVGPATAAKLGREPVGLGHGVVYFVLGAVFGAAT